MSTTDAEQRGILVRQHARMAQGVKLDGTSMQPKGGAQSEGGSSKAKPAGGLSHLAKKKK
jgi:hypothetical protein